MHVLNISAYDLGSPSLSSNMRLVVNVQDINDQPPRFNQTIFRFRVREDAGINSLVGKVYATDLDTSERVSYTTVDGHTFTALPSDGSIVVRAPLDREHQDRYVLTVRAHDSGVPPMSAEARVEVTVVDSNDNRPMFDQDSYEYRVPENLEGPRELGRVLATDEDEGQNKIITYFLEGQSSPFAIDEETGHLSVLKRLDREEMPSYGLWVVARDGGTPALSSTVSVS